MFCGSIGIDEDDGLPSRTFVGFVGIRAAWMQFESSCVALASC